MVNGKTGVGHIESIDETALEMTVQLTDDPPPRLPLRLILALPRPKVLNRTIAAAASMGIPEIDLINAWRVEKAYWESPRVTEENLREQSILGLEQSADTILPTIRFHRLFAPFVREELARSIGNSLAFVAHPGAMREAPRHNAEHVILAIGPEGGFIDREVDSFRDVGFTPISLGRRILRVETALAFLMGRIF
jgi:RsmE family RNA methyltransferase